MYHEPLVYNDYSGKTWVSGKNCYGFRMKYKDFILPLFPTKLEIIRKTNFKMRILKGEYIEYPISLHISHPLHKLPQNITNCTIIYTNYKLVSKVLKPLAVKRVAPNLKGLTVHLDKMDELNELYPLLSPFTSLTHLRIIGVNYTSTTKLKLPKTLETLLIDKSQIYSKNEDWTNAVFRNIDVLENPNLTVDWFYCTK